MRRPTAPPGCDVGVRRDRGVSDALGLVLLAPAAIGLAVLVVALGRDVDGRAQVRSAASAAAQAAALERDAASASAAADRVVRTMLVDADGCARPTASTSYPPPPPPGATTGGTVSVTVTCVVTDRGVELVRSGDRALSATATATVDVFRARSAP